ncbi:MAG: UMP kinase [Clostridia bacterium]|nr:UMP kinase [Clostridia bacterium]
MEPKYKRVLLKLSGEALAQGSDGNSIYNFELLNRICTKVKECVALGVQVAIVVGAGNIWRGKQGTDFQRVRADHMGMLATAINSLALQDALEHLGVDARVMSAIEMETFTETYIRDKAVSHLNHGRVVIFACGIGSPYFSTDTAAVLRAKEIDAEIVLLAKNIDAVYTADPKKDPNAKRLENIRYIDVLSQNLAVMDSTATSFSMENALPVLVFGLSDPQNIIRAVMGEKLGTIVNA